jgi:hypothetical protein
MIEKEETPMPQPTPAPKTDEETKSTTSALLERKRNSRK